MSSRGAIIVRLRSSLTKHGIFGKFPHGIELYRDNHTQGRKDDDHKKHQKLIWKPIFPTLENGACLALKCVDLVKYDHTRDRPRTFDKNAKRVPFQQLGRRPSLGWRPVLGGWRPMLSVVGWRPLLVGYETPCFNNCHETTIRRPSHAMIAPRHGSRTSDTWLLFGPRSRRKNMFSFSLLHSLLL